MRKIKSRGPGTKATLVAAFISLCCCPLASLAALPAGGIIGNGKYVTYESKLLKLKTVRPESWDQLEVGSGVTFLEPETEAPSKLSGASIHIDARKFAEIRTLEDLEHYLRFFQPEYSWEARQIGGVPGFRGVKGSEGAEYYLRKAGEVVTAIYKTSESASAATHLETILGSLELN